MTTLEIYLDFLKHLNMNKKKLALQTYLNLKQ